MPFSDRRHQECLEKVDELKLEGNGLFKAGSWTEALVAYRTALGHLPPRKRTLNQSADRDPSAATDDAEAPADEHDESPQNEPEPPNVLESECSKARAILNANIAACLIKLVSSNDLHQTTKALILI